MNRLPSLMQRLGAQASPSKLAHSHDAKAALAEFQRVCFAPELPCLLPSADPSSADLSLADRMPAGRKWFTAGYPPHADRPRLSTMYFKKFRSAVVPIELTRRIEDKPTSFARFDAPLSVFLDHIEYNQRNDTVKETVDDGLAEDLYLAQCSIPSLPEELQEDVPTPLVVKEAGRGDVYDSSIWIGMPPTFTPLHRDPNPNLFMQLAGTKLIRLFPPSVGQELFQMAQQQVGGSASAAVRGEEMMQGAERDVLEALVWDDSKRPTASADEAEFEALVEEGDAVFIPKGWWHSVRSVGMGISGSANWWFR